MSESGQSSQTDPSGQDLRTDRVTDPSDLPTKAHHPKAFNFPILIIFQHSLSQSPYGYLCAICIPKSNKLLNYSKNLAHAITKRVHFCHAVVLRHGCDVYATALCRSTIIALYMDVHMHHFILCTLFHYIPKHNNGKCTCSCANTRLRMLLTFYSFITECDTLPTGRELVLRRLVRRSHTLPQTFLTVRVQAW